MPHVPAGPLHVRLERALLEGDGAVQRLAGAGASAVDRRDEALALLAVHDLHLAPLDQLGDRARWQHHPVVAALKLGLEQRYVERLGPVDSDAAARTAAATVRAVRALAAADALPAVYRWVAEEADAAELVAFLALEGGPDAGFDDLVAVCQVGIGGGPKLELARNYWDEMGRGDSARVHAELHRGLVRATGMRPVPAPSSRSRLSSGRC